MLRVSEPGMEEKRVEGIDVRPLADAAGRVGASETTAVHEVLGGKTSDGESTAERLDELSFRYYGDSSLWRVLASANGVERLPWLSPGRLLRIPSLSALRSSVSARLG